ncbi:MAG: hypothetical protein D6808_08195 [Candidatus Dadabacteria bacterium]|nr:MAG: hypothetical protein D6808_08195 [Candidatus Dadabacteria bacterium]
MASHRMKSPPTREFRLDKRRSIYVDIRDLMSSTSNADSSLVSYLDDFDLIYRTLCGILYNFVPTSGHPGGSISSGRIVASLLFNTMSYDISNPDAPSADIISYAAGHKAMGLYAMWALRNEIAKQYDESLLPKNINDQLRLEDLLGFRRNPTQHTPLFKEYKAKPLDGHPCPIVPFVKLSTGASGVGVGSSFGLGVGARDYYGETAPLLHVIEGEAGITPGRTHEAMAMAATAQLNNIIMHLDWNQSSIDSDRVCREKGEPGEYVQWNPLEYGYFHEWNVIYVPEGFNFSQIIQAQELASSKLNDQPTLVVYRTVKGWQYGIEGKASHGAGHKYCSEEYYDYLKPCEERFGVTFPRLENQKTDEEHEKLFFDTLLAIREILERKKDLVTELGSRLKEAKERTASREAAPRANAPEVNKVYTFTPDNIPQEVLTAPGQTNTLRGALGNVIGYMNQKTNGALLVCAADLYGSTSIKAANKGFPDGFWNAVSNPECRVLTVGGITEDAMGCVMSGVSAFGRNIGVSSSYGAFIAALEHIPARLHAIGQQAKHDRTGEPYNPFIVVCAHAGIKTGEDGPTHADPQPLQLFQENFPKGSAITLTPWDPNEMWSVLTAALARRPAVIAPFVTRPKEKIFDRASLGIPPVEEAAKGIYAVRKADMSSSQYNGTVIIQGSGVMNTFVDGVLEELDRKGYNLNIYYITSCELFDLLPQEEQEAILPMRLTYEAMGITGFTLPTMYRWIRSEEGRKRTVFPFKEGRFLGSGKAHKVMEEARLHPEGQLKAIEGYAHFMEEESKEHPKLCL